MAQQFKNKVWTTAKTEQFTNGQIEELERETSDFQDVLNAVLTEANQIELLRQPLEARKQAVTQLLSRERWLIVVDNLETMEKQAHLVKLLSEILGQSKALLTTRHALERTEVRLIRLGGLEELEAREFLKKCAEPINATSVLSATPTALDEIRKATGGMPLAMRLVVSQMINLPRDEVLKALKERNPDKSIYDLYRFIFFHSWELLKKKEREAFVSMAAFPDLVGGDWSAVQGIVNPGGLLSSTEFRQVMQHLVDMSLIELVGAGGSEEYQLHP